MSSHASSVLGFLRHVACPPRDTTGVNLVRLYAIGGRAAENVPEHLHFLLALASAIR
jgi:hypothetical protein